MQGACRRQELSFLPPSVESLGSWHALAVEEVSKLGAALGRQTEQEEREAPSQLFHKLMVLLMKGNCTLFLNRSPPEE